MAEELVPIFYAKDARESARWYARLGFSIEGEHRFAEAMPLYLFLRRGSIALHLSEHKNDAWPNSLAYFYVRDIDAIATEFNTQVKEQP